MALNRDLYLLFKERQEKEVPKCLGGAVGKTTQLKTGLVARKPLFDRTYNSKGWVREQAGVESLIRVCIITTQSLCWLVLICTLVT